VHTERVTAATTPGPSGSDRQRAVLNALAVQLMRESPRLVRAVMNRQVLALGCTGARARRCGWGLAATAATLGALYVNKPSPVLALMLTAALVPGTRRSAAERQPQRTRRAGTSLAGLAATSRQVTSHCVGPGRRRSSRSPGPKTARR